MSSGRGRCQFTIFPRREAGFLYRVRTVALRATRGLQKGENVRSADLPPKAAAGGEDTRAMTGALALPRSQCRVARRRRQDRGDGVMRAVRPASKALWKAARVSSLT